MMCIRKLYKTMWVAATGLLTVFFATISESRAADYDETFDVEPGWSYIGPVRDPGMEWSDGGFIDATFYRDYEGVGRYFTSDLSEVIGRPVSNDWDWRITFKIKTVSGNGSQQLAYPSWGLVSDEFVNNAGLTIPQEYIRYRACPRDQSGIFEYKLGEGSGTEIGDSGWSQNDMFPLDDWYEVEIIWNKTTGKLTARVRTDVIVEPDGTGNTGRTTFLWESETIISEPFEFNTLAMWDFYGSTKETGNHYFDDLLIVPAAFPGAEGFGKFARGGRGGDVYTVTNLNDYDPLDGTVTTQYKEGTLRYGLESQSGPRTIVFDVAGNIELESVLTVGAFVTLAGQTAPGDGISISDFPLQIVSHDVIVRNLRVRLGDRTGDVLGGSGQVIRMLKRTVENVIFDHCSISWGSDTMIMTESMAKNITVQRSIISEPLHYTYHPDVYQGKEGHGYAVQLNHDGSGSGYTFHHNLFAHVWARLPTVSGKGGTAGARSYLDWRNNLHYNTRIGGISSSPRSQADDYIDANYVNNYFIRWASSYLSGPKSDDSIWYVTYNDKNPSIEASNLRIYPYGNVVPITGNELMITFKDKWQSLVEAESGSAVWSDCNDPDLGPWPPCDDLYEEMDYAFVYPYVETQTAEQAYGNIRHDVGALPWDLVDARIIGDIENNTGEILNSQNHVGGWPILKTHHNRQDSDYDGMADAWEDALGLNSNDPNDRNGDTDSDGYTNLEEYLSSFYEKDPSLEMYLSFDEYAGSYGHDFSGKQRTVDHAMANPDWQFFGGVNRGALGFDGVNDWAWNRGFDYSTATNEFTISLWFKVGFATGNTAQWLFSHGATNAADSINVYLVDNYNSTVRGRVRTLVQVNGVRKTVTHGSNLADGRWHMYAVTYSNGQMTTYLDSVQYPSFAAPQGTFYPDSGIFIGTPKGGNVTTRHFGGPRPEDGLMDEVKIYSRALTGDEIGNEYDLLKKINDPNLEWWLRLDDGRGATAHDYSGNGADGTRDGLLKYVQPGGSGPQWIPGGLSFDEVDDYIEVPGFDYTDSNEGCDSCFSLSFWFKVNDISGNHYQYMFSQGSGSETVLYVFMCEDGNSCADGAIRTIFRTDDGEQYSSDLGSNLADGSWHLYALTYHSDYGPTVYIDGDCLDNDPTVTGTFSPEDENMFVASTPGQADDRFFGKNDPDGPYFPTVTYVDESEYELGMLHDFRIYSCEIDEISVENIYKGISEPSVCR